MKGFLRVLFTPSCWIQNNPCSAIWDRKLRKLITTENFTEFSKYHATIGGIRLWVTNHPYASFVPEYMGIRPRRITILEAMDKLQEDMFCASPNMEVRDAYKEAEEQVKAADAVLP